MKKFASVLVAAAMLAFTAIANAGVILDEKQVSDQLNGSKVTSSRTVMIEGDKQKLIIDYDIGRPDRARRVIITDLGKGTMTEVDGRGKSYLEFPFPPSEGMGAMMASMAYGLPTISLKKTAATTK
jgi:hypothetical protein